MKDGGEEEKEEGVRKKGGGLCFEASSSIPRFVSIVSKRCSL